MKFSRFSLALLICLATAIETRAANAAPAATQPADATVQVYSARVSRASNNTNQETHKRFGGPFYSDGSPGVTMQLLLTLKDGAMLPFTREHLSIDTFVDDTYENLLAGQHDRYSGQQPVVSVDGREVMFMV